MMALTTIRDGLLIDTSLLREGPLARALAALNFDGEETRLVGGAVRDLVLGQPVGDFDLATTALPDAVMRRARAAGFGVAPTGLKHGTVTLIGLVAVLLGLITLGLTAGRGKGAYIPARVENGALIPGHIE